MRHTTPLLMLLIALGAGGCHQTPPSPAGPPGTAEQAPAFDPGALAQLGPPPEVTQTPVAVIQHSPTGPDVTPHQIKVRFNQPVFALSTAQNQHLDTNPFQIDPPLSGQARWLTPSVLVFEPKGLQHATDYTVTLNPSPGIPLEAPLTWSFQTPTLSLKYNYPEDRQAQIPTDSPIHLFFDSPIDLKTLGRHLTVTHNTPSGAKPLKVTIKPIDEEARRELWGGSNPKHCATIEPPRRGWPKESTIGVHVAKEMTSTIGPLPMGQPWRMTFQTWPKFKLTKHTCTAQKPCQEQVVDLLFSAPLEDNPKDRISISPNAGEIEIDSYGYGEDWHIYGDFRAGQTYTMTLSPALTDEQGQRLGKTITTTLHFSAPDPSLRLSTTTGSFEPNTKATIGIEGYGVTRALARVQPIDDLLALHRSGANLLAPLKIAWPKSDAERRANISIKTDPKQDHWYSKALDLRQLSQRALGPVMVHITPKALTNGPSPPTTQGLYQLTNLATEWIPSTPRHLIRVTQLTDGQPVQGAVVSMMWPDHSTETLGQTDAEGLLITGELPKWTQMDHEHIALLHVRAPTGADQMFVHHKHDYTWLRDRSKTLPGLQPQDKIVGELLAERDVYRPGEPLHVVGWLGLDTPRRDNGLGLLPADQPVTIGLLNPDGDMDQRVQTTLGASGKLWASFDLPQNASLGYWKVQVVMGHGVPDPQVIAQHTVRVRQFRTPEFFVEAVAADDAIAYEEKTKVTALGTYYFGGPVSITQHRLATQCRPFRFRPPGLKDTWQVGAQPRGYYSTGRHIAAYKIPKAPQVPGRRDFEVNGKHGRLPYTNRCQTHVTFQDPTLQESVGSASFVIHPERDYLAIETPADPVAGQTHHVTLRAVDWQGNRTEAEGIKVVAERIWWQPIYAKKGQRRYISRWEEQRTKTTLCTVDLSKDGPDTTCALGQVQPGHHIFTLTELSGHAVTHAQMWVAEKDWAWRLEEPVERLTVSIAEENLKVGQSATVMIRAPQPTGRGILTLARNGLRAHHNFELRDGNAVIKLPVTEAWLPGIRLQVTLSQRPGQGRLPTLSDAYTHAKVNGEHRQQNVKVDVPQTASPRQKVTAKVTVTDHQEAPLKAGHIALWATDEAILSMTNYSVPDLVEAFTPTKNPNADHAHNYGHLRRAFTPNRLAERRTRLPQIIAGHGMGMGGRGAGGGGAAATARQNFKVTPLFLADARLDQNGAAEIPFDLPDNLTTFRVIAVASASLEDDPQAPGRFGSAESSIAVQAPLVVRPALPRGLRPGDSVELAAVINNSAGPAGELTVALRLKDPSGAVELDDDPEITLDVEAGSVTRVSFGAFAKKPGDLKVHFEATLEGDRAQVADAVEVPMSVRPEATLIETVAVYGELGSKARTIPVRLPGEVLPQHGGLSVDVTSTLLGGLQDAAGALIHYPYGCAEQTSSRMLPLLALSELTQTWPLGVEDPEGMIKDGLARLLTMQTHEGGFAYWPGGGSPHPYVSAYVTWILQMASAKGHHVPPKALDKALKYLEEVTQNPDEDWPQWRLDIHDTRRTLAAWVLVASGRKANKALDALHQRRARLPLFANAFVLMALHGQDPTDPRVISVRDHLLGQIDETPATAHVTETQRWDMSSFFHSDTRSSALVLMALLRVDPEHPLVQKLARGLMEARRGGHWRNTQENAFALLAMADFGRIYESQTPDFRVRAWAGDSPMMESRFEGRDFKTSSATLAMQDMLLQQGEAQVDGAPVGVTLFKEGQGRAYYRLAMTYAPRSPETLPALSQGLAVRRTLRTEQGVLADGKVASGQILAMDIEIKASTRVRYVAVDVPIAGGLELINLDLGDAGASMPMGGSRGWWVSHQELRDQRALLFANDLQPGTHHHTVYLRATSPGTFTMPPARAEAMYMPEVFGRTPGTTLKVVSADDGR